MQAGIEFGECALVENETDIVGWRDPEVIIAFIADPEIFNELFTEQYGAAFIAFYPDAAGTSPRSPI